MDSARFPDPVGPPPDATDAAGPAGPDGSADADRLGGLRALYGGQPGAYAARDGAAGPAGGGGIDASTLLAATIGGTAPIRPFAPEGGPPLSVPKRRAPIPVKIIVAGGFGVGKTTTVAAISEIDPLTTEAEMTSVAAGIDDPGPTGKTTTTVAMDFGCVTIDESLKLYLFGAPGQARFGFMWDDLARGALGALVVVDSTRLDDGFAAVDYFERAGLSFVVGVNAFNGQLAHDLDTVRWALALGEGIPVVSFDARDRLSVRDAVLVVLNRALDRAMRSPGPGR